MSERQATIDFTGLPQVIGGSITWSRGISPSAIQIETVPQSNFTQPVGDVTVTFAVRLPNGSVDPGDADAVTFTLVDCAVESSTIELTSRQTWRMTLYDRRWRWKRGEISGKYNQLKPDGTIDSATEKTNQELAELCLDALGETGYDVSAIPTTFKTAVSWDASNPAQALQEVCSAAGCEVTLQLDATNSVSIVANGTGELLPGSDVASLSGSITTGQAPSVLRAVTQPVLWQRRFLLEAVGMDTEANDNEILPIADLSYEPTGGFQDPLFMRDVTASEEAATLAKQTVYRWFRIKQFADGTLNLPSGVNKDEMGGITSISSIKQVQLTQGLIAKQLDGGKEVPQQPKLYGDFFDGEFLRANVSGKQYNKEFSVDTRRSLIVAREPIVAIDSDEWTMPTLYLEIAFTLEDANRASIRHRRDANYSGTSYDGGEHIVKTEKRRTIKMPYSAITTESTAVDNRTSLNTELDAILAVEENKFAMVEADEAVYAGIKLINVDGAIQQVVWNIGRGQAATTRAGRNKTADRLIPSERERKRREAGQRETEYLLRLFENDGTDSVFKTGGIV